MGVCVGSSGRRVHSWFAVAAVLLAVGGCGKSEPLAASGGGAGPAANVAVSAKPVQMAAGAELAQVRNPQLIHPQFYLTPPEVDAALIFAAVRTETDTGMPVILRKGGSGAPAATAGGGWRLAQLAESPKQEWVYAAACPPRQEVWAILDNAGDAKAWQLTPLRSTDGGQTWQYAAAVKKPANGAIYAGFALAANGKGRLSMHLEEDADGHSHGYYHYATADGGTTWTGPTAEPNDVAEADPFDAAETLPGALKAAEAVPGVQ